MKNLISILILIVTISASGQGRLNHPIDKNYTKCLDESIPTTKAALDCANKATKQWQGELTKRYNLLWNKLAKADKDTLTQAHKKWKVAHKKELQLARINLYKEYSGGTLWRLAFAKKERELVKKQALILQKKYESVIDTTLKIISYNIRYDNDWDKENAWQDRKYKIVDLLKKYNPAVFGIQEALENQVVFIDKSFSQFSYIGIGRDGGNKGEFSPIFYDNSKFKVLENGTFWLSKTPSKASKGWDAALNRICTYGLFENLKTNKKMWVFNTHFDHKGAKARKKSAVLILKKIQQLNTANYPVILMGDLNTKPHEKPLEILKTKLSDALEISAKPLNGSIGTFNAFKNEPITTRIDYIFIQKLEVLAFTHIDDLIGNSKHISDHNPVMITIKNK